MGLEVRRVPLAGIPALVTPGEISDAEIAEVAARPVFSIAINNRSFRSAGESLAWVERLPRIENIYILGSAKTPDLLTVPASVSTLFVLTTTASPVPSAQLGNFSRIHSEYSDFCIDGYVNLPHLEQLELGRVGASQPAMGDGSHSLRYLKLRGKKQIAQLNWADPPRALRTFMSHDMRWKDLDALGACADLESVQIYNPSVLVGADRLDVGALAECKRLTLLHVAQNLPVTGVPAVLDGAPGVTASVARDLHDAAADHPRIHLSPVRVRRG